jgi:hypothetical protein
MFMPLCLDLSYQITYRQAGLTVATSLDNTRSSVSQGISSTGEYTGRLHVNCSLDVGPVLTICTLLVSDILPRCSADTGC